MLPTRIVSLIGVLLVLLAVRAAAEDAEALYHEGVIRFTAGKLTSSMRVLNRAKRIAKEPGLRGRINLYIGLIHAVAGRSGPAKRAFSTALSFDPELALDPKRFKPALVKLFDDLKTTMSGTLAVTADRDDALLFVDGKEVGRVPYTGNLSIGPHELSLRTVDRKFGHATRIVVAPDRVTRIEARLERKRAATEELGRIVIHSRPKGATVWLDGKVIGKTPTEVRVATGLYTLKLEREDHRPVVRRVKASAAELTKVTEDLELTRDARSRLEQAQARKRARLRSDRVAAETRQQRRRKKLWATASLIVGTGLAAGATVLYGVGKSQGDEAYERYKNARSEEEFERYRSDLDSAETKMMIGHALIGTAVGVLGFSLYQFLTRPSTSGGAGSDVVLQRDEAVLRLRYVF